VTIRDRILDLRRVAAGQLVPHPQNWRTHPDAQRRLLGDLFTEVGFAAAVIARELPDGRLQIIDGHLRQEEVPAEQEIPVLVLDVTEAEARKLLLSLDPLAAMAESAEDRLQELAVQIEPETDGLRKLVSFMAKDHGAREKDTPAGDPPKEPETELGTLWQLGPHRVLCADALDANARVKLMGGEATAMVATDPPYAIYGSSSGVSSAVADDRMVRPFFEAMLGAFAELLPLWGHGYTFCDWRSWASVWEGSRRSGLTPKNMLVWDKGDGGLGNNYANTHELIGFFAKLPPPKTMRAGGPTGQRPVLRPNILRFDRTRGAEREHNAAKPVALLEELITNSSETGQIVVDLFGGSGSTLIAAENLGRRCFTMEIDPVWCDVIVDRWRRATGGEAKRDAA